MVYVCPRQARESVASFSGSNVPLPGHEEVFSLEEALSSLPPLPAGDESKTPNRTALGGASLFNSTTPSSADTPPAQTTSSGTQQQGDGQGEGASAEADQHVLLPPSPEASGGVIDVAPRPEAGATPSFIQKQEEGSSGRAGSDRAEREKGGGAGGSSLLSESAYQQRQSVMSTTMRFAQMREYVLRNDASVTLGPNLMETWGLSQPGSQRGEERASGGSSFVEMGEEEMEEETERSDLEEEDEDGEDEEANVLPTHGTPGPPVAASSFSEEKESERRSQTKESLQQEGEKEKVEGESESTKDSDSTNSWRRRREPGGYFAEFLQQNGQADGQETPDASITSVPAGSFEEITFGFTSVKRTGFNHIETWPNEEGTLTDQLSLFQPQGGRVAFARGVLFHYGGSLRMHGKMPPLIRGDGLANGFTIYLTLKFSSSAAGKRKQVLFDNGHGFQIVALPSKKKELTGLRVGFLWEQSDGSSEEGEEGDPEAEGGGYFAETCFGHVQSFVFSGYTAGGKMRLSIYKEQLAGSAFELGGGFKQTAADPRLSGDEGAMPAQEGQWVVGCGVDAKHCFDAKFVMKSQADALVQVAQTLDGLDGLAGRTTACGNGRLESGEDCDPLNDPKNLCSCTCHAKCPMFEEYLQTFSRHLLVSGSDGNGFGDWRRIACQSGFSSNDPAREDEVVMCKAKGKWEEPSIQCMADCTSTYAPPPELAVAGFTDATRHNTQLQVVCPGGTAPAEGITERSRTVACVDGEWTRPSLSCYPLCPEYTDLHGAYVVSPMRGAGSLRHGAIRNITCAEGYSKSTGTDPQIVWCENGKWAPQTLDCQLDCPVFEMPAGGHYRLKDGFGQVDLEKATHYGNFIPIVCEEGFAPASNRKGPPEEKVFCRGGIWDYPLLQCFAQCPPFEGFPIPPTLTDRYKVDFGGNSHGSVSVVTCKEGYGKEGASQEVQCLQGSYEALELDCHRRCPMFSLEDKKAYNISGGQDSGFGADAFREISCSPGFSPVGTSRTEKLLCIDGQWSMQTLVCRQNCPTADLYSKLCDPLPDGSGCRGAYLPQMTDKEGRTIAGSLPREISYGTKINVQCNEKKGFRAIESEIGKSQQISCMGDPDLQQADRVELSWFSALILTCEKVCSREDIMDVLSSPAYEVAFRDPGGGEAYTPAMDMRDRVKFDPGAEAKVVCAANFSSSSLLQGGGEDAESLQKAEDAREAAAVDVLRCIEGEWSARTLACAPLCPEYTELDHFPEYAVKGRGTEHGNEREITCAEKASAATEERRQVVRCVNGLWTARTIMCRRDCAEGDLPNARKGYMRDLVHDGSNSNRPYTSHGAVWQFQCDAGFSPVKCDGGRGCRESKPEDTGFNTAQVTCVNGMFTPLTLLCMRDCPPFKLLPDDIRNNRYVIENPLGPNDTAHHGHALQVVCNETNFQHHVTKESSGVALCEDGTWTRFDLQCKKSCVQQKTASGPDDDPRLFFPPWGYNLTETPPRVSENSPRIPHGSRMEVECAEGWRPSSGTEPSPVLCDDGKFSRLWLVCAEDCRPEDVPIHSKSHMVVVGHENTGPEIQWRGLPMSHGIDHLVKCAEGTYPVPGTATDENMGEMKCRWGKFSKPLLQCHPPCNLDGLRQDIVAMGGRYIVRTVGTVDEATKPGGMVRVECREDAEPIDRQNVQVLSCLNGAFQKVSIFCRAKCPDFDKQEEGYIYTRLGGTIQERSVVDVMCEHHLSTAALADGTPVMSDHELLECMHGVWMDRRIVCYRRCPLPISKGPGYEYFPSLNRLALEFPSGLRHGHTVHVKCAAGYGQSAGTLAPTNTQISCNNGVMQRVDMECNAKCPPFETQWHNYNPKLHKIRMVVPDDVEWRSGLTFSHGSQIEIRCNIDSRYSSMGPQWNETETLMCVHGRWEFPSIACDKSCRFFEEDDGIMHLVDSKEYELEYDLYGEMEEYLKAGATATLKCKQGYGPMTVVNNGAVEVQKTFYPKVEGEPWKDRLICLGGKWMGSTMVCRKLCPEYSPDSSRVAVYMTNHMVEPKGKDITEEIKAWPEVLHGTKRLLRCKGDTNRRSGFFPAAARHMVRHETSMFEEVTCLDGHWSPASILCLRRCNPTYTAVLRDKCIDYHTKNVHSPCNKALSRYSASEWEDAIKDREDFDQGKDEKAIRAEQAQREKLTKAAKETGMPPPPKSSSMTSKSKMDTQLYKCAERKCTKSDMSPYKIVRSILRDNPAAYDPLGGPVVGEEDLLDRARLHGDLHIITCNTAKGFSPVWRQLDSFNFEQNFFDTVGTVQCNDGRWSELPFQCDRGCPGPFDIYDPMKNQWLPLFTQNRLEYYKEQAKLQSEAPSKPSSKNIMGPLASEEMRSFVNSHDQVGRAERAPALIWKIEARRIMGLLAAPWWTMYMLGNEKYPDSLKAQYDWQKYEKMAEAFKKKVKDSPKGKTNLGWKYKLDQFATEGHHPDFIQNVNETIPLYKHWAIWGPGCCDPTNCWRGLWGPSSSQCSSRWWGRGSWVAFERLENGKRSSGREVYYSFCNAGGTWVPSERITSGSFPQDSVQTIMYHPEYHVLNAVPDHRTSEDFFFSEPVLPTLVDPRRKAQSPWQVNIKDIRGGPGGEVVLDAYNVSQSREPDGWGIGEPAVYRDTQRYPFYTAEEDENRRRRPGADAAMSS
uniref:Sushi domain-containing protein n=1 Tax=Chromera velia CCMP2878 TaxID=1169474 RepID=A0A0G4IEK6_9ALVE|eukprot:Cvel_2414.t1-p1 / transcript=Cvel_2414.t1 / gene=Cvel_2414 / organism=Chromera_velia_CCMP2878 / gene_product=P-selectin, putative / transcript_product=P-selectin, putative / location=Cvel_scaffold94:57290-82804(-) / protein_length=2648 / sequence_SO=supercontig / SO=protein_coding / is_pseudo=false